MRRRLVALITLGLLGGGMVAASPATAQPSVLNLLTCPLGTQSTTYSPGLTYTTRPTSYVSEGVVTGCVDLSGHGITSATYTGIGSGTAGCLESSLTNTMSVNWSNGQSSTVTGTGTIQLKPNGTSVVVHSGQVTSGAFNGSGVTLTLVLTSLDLLGCLTPEGLTNTGGPVTLTVL
ncbi:hypothetical protein [Streptomyces sp. ALB3]|uniref:hypothetical protein n=1 Tax=Streptomyces sp. ALB3 TaxID=3374278 RepID=UPI00378E0B70